MKTTDGDNAQMIPRADRIPFRILAGLAVCALVFHVLPVLAFRPIPPQKKAMPRPKRVTLLGGFEKMRRTNMDYSLLYLDPRTFLHADDASGFGYFRTIERKEPVSNLPFVLPPLPDDEFSSMAIAPLPRRELAFSEPLYLPKSIPADPEQTVLPTEYPMAVKPSGKEISLPELKNALNGLPRADIELSEPSVFRIPPAVEENMPREPELLRSSGIESLDRAALRAITLLLHRMESPPDEETEIISVYWHPTRIPSKFTERGDEP